jgi:predicted nucleic acid-binding protein
VKAVSNAGPLMALGKLGLMSLLHALYDPVLIPAAVYEEVVTRGLAQGQPDAYAVQLAIARNEIAVIDVPPESLSEVIQAWPLDLGEKHAIQLAVTEAADWVLLDDRLARECAQQLGLNVKGTLGLIVAAYHRQLLSLREVEVIFQSILDRDDIWLNDDLVKQVLERLRN